jgi:hypothetical protein
MQQRLARWLESEFPLNVLPPADVALACDGAAAQLRIREWLRKGKPAVSLSEIRARLGREVMALDAWPSGVDPLTMMELSRRLRDLADDVDKLAVQSLDR